MKKPIWLGILGLLVMSGLQLVPTESLGGDSKKALTVRSQPIVAAVEAEKRTKKLNERVSWHTDLEQAMKAAKEQDKPLFWLQVVGGLDAEL